jgi:hypothetical protein
MGYWLLGGIFTRTPGLQSMQLEMHFNGSKHGIWSLSLQSDISSGRGRPQTEISKYLDNCFFPVEVTIAVREFFAFRIQSSAIIFSSNDAANAPAR